MENDALKSAWGAQGAPKTNNDLKNMLGEKSHPVLKPIRRQLIFETLVFTAFLFVYYDFFDGDQKPLYANLALIAGVFTVIAHHATGYFWIKQPAGEGDLKQMLQNELSKVRQFGAVSLLLRIVMAGCLLLYFSSVVVFDTTRYMLLSAVIMVFIVQMFLTARMWRSRAQRIHNSITQLTSI